MSPLLSVNRLTSPFLAVIDFTATVEVSSDGVETVSDSEEA